MNTHTCERCGEQRGEKDMRGNLCGWCADDIARVDSAVQEEVARFQGQRDYDPNQLSLSDADVAILWHARLAQEGDK